MPQHVIPFADYRPIAWAEARDDATNPTCIILHLTASEATSQYSYFSNPANKACSNTHVARDGRIEQYIRGDRLSAAEAYGSSRAFSIETQGADASGRWTAEQCESNAQIIAWAHRTYGIPLRLMTSSATGQTGVGWHRLGVDGNWPGLPNILAGRVQRGGGEVWSSHFGKVCPGDARIKQIPAILERAIAIVNGADTPGGFMTDLTEQEQKAVLWNVREIKKHLDEQDPVLWNVRQIKGQVDELTRANRAQTAAIEALAKNAGLDPKVVTAAVEKAVREALPTSVTIPLEG